MTTNKKTFTYHWGSGYVAEEAQVEGAYNLPTFQLLKYTDGPAAGEISIRFCHYSHQGRFRRSPLLMSSQEIDTMREALHSTPELREFLLRLLGE
ncbi:MAG: hypothetical protein ACE5Q6_00785 [Dehalococcoidia bacterium]